MGRKFKNIEPLATVPENGRNSRLSLL